MTRLVIGMGDTGLSMARHWSRAGFAVEAVDDRAAPPRESAFAAELPAARWRVGEAFRLWSRGDFARYDRVGVSPGVAPADIAAAPRKLTTDSALFAENRRRLSPDVRVLAATGTNGKSTAVSLAAHLARAGDVSAQTVGNIGKPLLDALAEWEEGASPRLVVVELSSFQLELTPAFGADAATVLNVGNDHLDRHGERRRYADVKGRIYRGAARAVVNVDDSEAAAGAATARKRTTFSAAGAAADWMLSGGEIVGGGCRYSLAGMSPACRAQPVATLAALALLADLPLPREGVAAGLASFPGLEHRQQFLGEINGVRYVNDSKATNVDATLFGLAAVGGGAILIAGGDGKGQDFSRLRQARQWARRAVLIGRDAGALEGALAAGGVACERAVDMEEATRRAAAAARPNDTVLLSPACASFDMFADYAARGAEFSRVVGRLRREAGG